MSVCRAHAPATRPVYTSGDRMKFEWRDLTGAHCSYEFQPTWILYIRRAVFVAGKLARKCCATAFFPPVSRKLAHVLQERIHLGNEGNKRGSTDPFRGIKYIHLTRPNQCSSSIDKNIPLEETTLLRRPLHHKIVQRPIDTETIGPVKLTHLGMFKLRRHSLKRCPLKFVYY